MIKILSATQFRDWDKYTINHEPVSSLDLMERASSKAVDKILQLTNNQHYTIICGTGNNGGDGLAIARLLHLKGFNVSIYQIAGSQYSHDCSVNRARLKELIPINEIHHSSDVFILKQTCIIDALLGTGQNKPVKGLIAEIVDLINNQSSTVISIDLPTGMQADASSKNEKVVRADHVLSFQSYKTCFFLPENDPFLGVIHILEIGLLVKFLENQKTQFNLIEKSDIQSIVNQRNKFSHKGNYGTALLVGGSEGMMGALVLSLKSCLRTGVGKAFGSVEKEQFSIIQQAIPEAILESRTKLDNSESSDEYDKFNSFGIGPGLGINEKTEKLIFKLMQWRKPLVIDADALNIIAKNRWLAHIPSGSVLTPHIGELNRLFGPSTNDFERIEKCTQIANELQVYIILKGRYSLIICPDGEHFINPTGNPGMAKAGTGDVLTGMITSLISQGKSPKDACLIAVYLHGLAADIAVRETSEYSLLASDIIDNIGNSFLKLAQTNA